jgi:hypothetical protein
MEVSQPWMKFQAELSDCFLRSSWLRLRSRRMKMAGSRTRLAGDDGDAGVLHRGRDRLDDAAAVAELLLVAAEHLDAEVDADAQHHRDDRDRQDVEVPDRDEREAERPEHAENQGEKGEARAPEENHVEHGEEAAARGPDHAVAEKEEQQDQADGDAARLDRVPSGGADLLVVERGFAGDFQFDAGELGLEIGEVLTNFFERLAVGCERIGLDLARVGEN